MTSAYDTGRKTCLPTIVGVGGTANLCVHFPKVAATRALVSQCTDPASATLEAELSAIVNKPGGGSHGLVGNANSFAVHVASAAAHIAMNPIACNMRCHPAPWDQSTPQGVSLGF